MRVCTKKKHVSHVKNGRDVIVLNRSYGAKGFGHNAVLIGNDKDGWTYFSKDGNNPVNGTYNPETGHRANSKDEFKDKKILIEIMKRQNIKHLMIILGKIRKEIVMTSMTVGYEYLLHQRMIKN
ncbi:MAG: hypothetical protein J6Y36_03170 [Treponema sp.]|nr:hypothetical protein [Treponema sp.]